MVTKIGNGISTSVGPAGDVGKVTKTGPSIDQQRELLSFLGLSTKRNDAGRYSFAPSELYVYVKTDYGSLDGVRGRYQSFASEGELFAAALSHIESGERVVVDSDDPLKPRSEFRLEGGKWTKLRGMNPAEMLASSPAQGSALDQPPSSAGAAEAAAAFAGRKASSSSPFHVRMQSIRPSTPYIVKRPIEGGGQYGSGGFEVYMATTDPRPGETFYRGEFTRSTYVEEVDRGPMGIVRREYEIYVPVDESQIRAVKYEGERKVF